MRIILVGINHRTADVELREKLTMDQPAVMSAVQQFRAHHPSTEIVILSTCGRTEVYIARPEEEDVPIEEVLAMLGQRCQVNPDVLRASSIHRENEQAIGHLFRVTTGLDSMVLGEPQILGQVKRSYETAVEAQAVGTVLHRLFQKAIAVGKQLRTNTGIDAGQVSIGSIAVDFARQIFERFDNKTIVGVGAGEMAKVTLRHLWALKPAKLWLTNRSLDRAQSLAQTLGLDGHPGGARTIEDLDELLVEADIVVASAAANELIITAKRFQPLLRRRRQRPLFVIDIAVPRNVEPAVGQLKNVYLYNIDDLHTVAARTHKLRGEQIQQCEILLFDAVRECMSEIRHRDIGQMINALKHKLHDLARVEQQRTTRKLTSIDPDLRTDLLPQALEEYTHRLINKILHLPLSQLDHRQPEAPLGFYAAALRKLFDITDAQGSAPTVSQDPTPAATLKIKTSPSKLPKSRNKKSPLVVRSASH